MENRSGLVVAARLTQATGLAEREAAASLSDMRAQIALCEGAGAGHARHMLRRWIERLLIVEGLNSLAGFLGLGNPLGYLVSGIALLAGAAAARIGYIEGPLKPYGAFGIIVTALGVAFLLAAILVGAAWAVDRWRHILGFRAKRYEQLVPAPSDRTSTAANIRDLHLHTPAELLHEQELRDVLRAVQEFVEEIGNKARKDLEATLTSVAAIAACKDTDERRALKFFVEEAILRGHRERMKSIIRDTQQSISERSIDRAEGFVINFISEYRHGERCLGILITATSVDPTAVEQYQKWLQSDHRYVARYRELN
jgi:hypothetical protein